MLVDSVNWRSPVISELGRCCRGFTLFGCCVPRVAAMVRGLRFSTFDPGSQVRPSRDSKPQGSKRPASSSEGFPGYGQGSCRGRCSRRARGGTCPAARGLPVAAAVPVSAYSDEQRSSLSLPRSLTCCQQRPQKTPWGLNF